ncbi:hypothetical protein F4782DRAFT_179977 [Xylaria castorea]|nr:hypothetical protein F4782DRAFT_179977 [Xylaria castorea]
MPRSEQASFSPRAVGGRKFVAFFHPSYPDTAPPLLTLAAVDSVREGAQVIKGIDYDTAKTACGIVACNCYDDGAYFALKSRKGGWARFERPADGLLRASGDFTFYFVVDTPTLCYPVVPSFDHWRFPHRALPPRWASLSGSEHATDDLGNGVGHSDHEGAGEPLCFKETDFARVAPFSHTSWCDSNLMENFCRHHGAGRSGISCLFTDIRRCFPENRMDSMPYGHHPERFELHPELLLQGIMDTAIHSRRVGSGHDYEVSPISVAGVTREHLFARFAFHVLSDANYRFLGGALKYTVCLFDVEKAEEYTAELYSDDITDLSHIFPPPITTALQYAESDKSDEDEDSSCSPGASSSDDSCHTSERRIGRRRHRSPTYYWYRDRCEASQQGRNDADYAESFQDITRSHHASSIGGLSLSSTLSISSLDTPQSSRTPENVNDRRDILSCSTDAVRSKRPYHDCSEVPDTSQSLKRLRLK